MHITPVDHFVFSHTVKFYYQSGVQKIIAIQTFDLASLTALFHPNNSVSFACKTEDVIKIYGMTFKKIYKIV